MTPQQAEWEHQRELARMQAAGMILQGMALQGGIVHPPQAVPYNYHLAPMVPITPSPYPPAFTPGAPGSPLMPPVSCTTRTVGGIVYTDCY